MKKIILAILIAALSAGWVFPMWLGVIMYLQFWQSEGWPLLLGHPHLNSLDFLHEARTAFEIAFCWLAFVVFGWAYTAIRFIQRHKT
jgi:hypothetical protein